MSTVVANAYSDTVKNMIPAFPKGDDKGPATVKYRLLDHGGIADEVDIDDHVTKNKKVLGQPTTMRLQGLIYDAGAGDIALINVSKSKQFQGAGANLALQDVVDYATFDKFGELTVTSVQQSLYRFMELHPRNKSNVLTGLQSENPVMPELGWLFERIQPEKTARELAQHQRLVDQVRGILGENTAEENLIIARRLKLNVTGTEDDVYTRLRTAAETDPELVYNATTDEATKVDALIQHALSAGIIEFVPADREYLDVTTRNRILSVPEGNPEEILRNYLIDTQGAGERTRLAKLLAEKDAKSGAKPKFSGPPKKAKAS